MHGYLYGYDEKTNQPDYERGRRIFCSNRNKRKGCGRTISIFKSNIIKGLTYTANTVWDFLNYISNGMNKINAFKQLNIKFTNSTVYRLFNKFKHKQPHIRTLLLKKSKPPDDIYTTDPFIKTMLHLKSVFNNKNCPISEFQETFQTSIFA